MVDFLTPQQRSALMSRIKGKDTQPELRLRSALHKRGLRFRKNVKGLPGTPDIVFPKAKVAVFVNGGFWHGYQLKNWRHKLNDKWLDKIETNRKRDARNIRILRKEGWKVLLFWDKQIRRDMEGCLSKIAQIVSARG